LGVSQPRRGVSEPCPSTTTTDAGLGRLAGIAIRGRRCYQGFSAGRGDLLPLTLYEQLSFEEAHYEHDGAKQLCGRCWPPARAHGMVIERRHAVMEAA
jgi:hypothetical protein